MGECKRYNQTEADETNINGFLMSVRIKKGAKVMNRDQWLQSEMFETKFIKIYFKEVNYKYSLKKTFVPSFEVLRQNIKTFQ